MSIIQAMKDYKLKINYNYIQEILKMEKRYSLNLIILYAFFLSKYSLFISNHKIDHKLLIIYKIHTCGILEGQHSILVCHR